MDLGAGYGGGLAVSDPGRLEYLGSLVGDGVFFVRYVDGRCRSTLFARVCAVTCNGGLVVGGEARYTYMRPGSGWQILASSVWI